MNTVSKAVLATGALIALSALAKAQASGTLNFLPGQVHSISFDGVTPVMAFDLIIQNPSSKSFNIRSLVGNIIANDILIGNVAAYQTTYVRPNGNTVYRLAVRLNVLGIVNDLIRALSGSGFAQTVRFKASANVDNFMVPISINYKIGQ